MLYRSKVNIYSCTKVTEELTVTKEIQGDIAEWVKSWIPDSEVSGSSPPIRHQY